MTTRSKTMTLSEAVQEALDGRESQIRCPAHDDEEPSLSVRAGVEHPVLINCHAGCHAEDIVKAGGMTWAEFCAPLEEDGGKPDMWTPKGEASKCYRYRDEDGLVLFEVMRVDFPNGGKRIFQRHPDPTAPHGHAWNLDGVRRVLYRLPDVIKAVREGHTIHVAEGEKCVHALQRVIPKGEEATCNPMGAGKWEVVYGQVLSGANVVLYADSDDAGRQHMRDVREDLITNGCTVKILEAPPGVMPNGKAVNDVADHIAASRTLGQMLETTPESQMEKARTGVDVLDLIRRPMSRVEFVIDGTMAAGERLLLIGFEGTGKSTLCRQIAVMVAGGLHPFTGMPMKEPRRVLFIDAENHPEQVQDDWAKLVGLMAKHQHGLERGMLTVLEEWEFGKALETPAGEAWLSERVHAYRPHLIVMGPLTNLADKDLRDDEPVRRTKNAVNKARAICNSAFVMEHHAPLKGPMDRERQLRPYGSSLFLKWPDYGFGLKPTNEPTLFEWYKNRGPRVRSRRWPSGLREGLPNTAEFPWMEANPEDVEAALTKDRRK